MSNIYTVLRIDDTENGWMIIHNDTGKQNAVFCRLDANTAEDAVAVLESATNEEAPAEE